MTDHSRDDEWVYELRREARHPELWTFALINSRTREVHLDCDAGFSRWEAMQLVERVRAQLRDDPIAQASTICWDRSVETSEPEPIDVPFDRGRPTRVYRWKPTADA